MFDLKKFLRNKKAVSPVISVVLLVGISVVASALAYAWYIGIQKGSGEATGETAARVSQSSAAAIIITNVDTSSGINVTVANIGSVNVTGLRLFVDNSQVSIAGKDYVDVGGVTNIWNSTTYNMASGVHTVKVVSREGAEASQVVVK